MSSPIQSGLQRIPLIRLHRDNPLRMTVTVDAAFPLAGLEVEFSLRSRFGSSRPEWLASATGEHISVDGQVISLIAEPADISDGAAQVALSKIQTSGAAAYELTMRGDVDGLPVGLALVGDLEFLGPGDYARDGALRAGTVANPEIVVTLVGGEIVVSVAVVGAADLASHSAETSGVHGISEAAATVLGEETVAEMRGALGLEAAFVPRVPLGSYIDGSNAGTSRLGNPAGSGVLVGHPNFGEITLIWGESVRSAYTFYGLFQGAHAVLSWGDVENGNPNVGSMTRLSRPSAGQLEATLSTGGRADILVRSLHATGPISIGSYTVATMPDEATNAGRWIEVADETGGPTLARSNGANWLRVADQAIIS